MIPSNYSFSGTALITPLTAPAKHFFTKYSSRKTSGIAPIEVRFLSDVVKKDFGCTFGKG